VVRGAASSSGTAIEAGQARRKLMTPKLGNRCFVAAALLCAAMFTVSACATNRPAEQQVSDSWITTKIKSKLAADPTTEALEVDVDTMNGVVRLSGIVDEDQERREAEELARQTDGVKRVINELRIGDANDWDVEHPVADDAAITANVKSRLTTDPDVSGLSIDVDTLDGVVTLFGTVNSERERAEAERLARNTDGVKAVRNQIQVQ
jgi:hyperosmotically inducible protein